MKTSASLACALVAMLLSHVPALTQCDSLYQLTLIDERSVFLPSSAKISDTAAHIPKHYFTPGHRFSFQSDSSSVVVDVLEYRLNQRSLMLQDWCNEKTWNWSLSGDTDTNEVTDHELSMKSRTKAFPLAAGDTVSMFRWFYIKDAVADTLSFWFSDQTVDAWVVIELVDQTSGNVISILDSTRFSSIDHRICIRSMLPSIARVMYIVPSQTPSTTAFVRVRVGNAGGNDYHWYRYDAIMDVVSWRMLPRSGVFNDRYRAGNICGH